MTPIHGRGGSRAFPTENRSKPSPEWNHYRIECRDGEISLAVNGAVVTRGKDCVPRKGYICLESEGGVVHYRNVRIRELPETEISPDHIAIANRGYRSLYTGLNLDGWESRANESVWKPKDWVLAFEGAENESGGLSTAEVLEKHFDFVVDVRLKDAASGAVIQAGSNLRIDLQDPIIASHLEEVGRWNRVEGALRDGEYFLEINGHRVAVETKDTDGGGSLTLEPTGPVDFCNIYAGSGVQR
jgi:hypothetical protein